MAKYKTLLSKSDADVQKENINHAVGQAELQIQSDILATKNEINMAKIILDKSKMVSPINPKSILDAQIHLEGLEDGLKRLEELQKELF